MKKLALLALLGIIMTVATSNVFASGIDSADDVVDPVALMEDDGTKYGYILPEYEEAEAELDYLNDPMDLN